MLSLSMATAFVVLTGCGGSDKPKAGAPATSSGSPVSAASNAASVAGAGAVAQPPIPEGQPAEAAAPGRFQIVASGQTRTGPFLLDTQTGRIWQLREFAGLQGSPVAWHEMTIIDDKGGMGIAVHPVPETLSTTWRCAATGRASAPLAPRLRVPR
jgi:hypothetical protein